MYKPAEDSFFFAEFLSKYLSKLKDKKISYLDMGCGTGILSEIVKQAKIKKILAADINQEAVDHANSLGIKAIKSDLFSNTNLKFDLITFNAPYLPKDKREPKSSQLETTGGKQGDEISIRFIKQAINHLNKNGKIFLLISSHTPQNKLKKFHPKIIATKNLFLEKLLILEINKD